MGQGPERLFSPVLDPWAPPAQGHGCCGRVAYAHGRLDEKAAALAQLGSAIIDALPSPFAVNEPQVDQRGS
jgi:hypothetical protein